MADEREQSAVGSQASASGGGMNGRVPDNTLQLLPFLFSFFKGCGLILIVWLLGYFGFSALWGMVILFLYLGNVEYKKIKEAKKGFARQAAIDEKNAILARTDELPSWVFFPDVERAEWLNKVIYQMWPYVGDYVQDILWNTVQPKVQESLPASLKSFKFVRIDLGDIPPRIGGVKVYKNTKRDEILMDLEVCYASDSNIKISIRGLIAGIKDLQIHGTLRVVMRPLVNVMPLIGGMNVFFLNNPTVDFDLTDLANALDFPGLSDTIRGIVEEQISYFMVLPNKILIQLAENIDITKLRYPMPQGVLRIHVVEASELKKADFKIVGKGKSDPYCKIYVGAQVFKTKVIQNTVEPEWNQYFEAIVDQRFGQYMEVEVMDEDPGEDDELGTLSIDLQTVANQGLMDSWLPLEAVETGRLHLRLMWLHLSPEPSDLETRQIQMVMKENFKAEQVVASPDHLCSAIIFVNLDSAQSLPRNKKALSEPSPYVVMNIGNVNKKSTTKDGTINPRWEENFQFLIQNPHLQELMFQVRDLKRDKKQVKTVVTDSKNDKNLGSIVFPLKALLTAREMTINRPFVLRESGPETKLNVRICMRVLTASPPKVIHAEEPSSPVTSTSVIEEPSPVEGVLPTETAVPEDRGPAVEETRVKANQPSVPVTRPADSTEASKPGEAKENLKSSVIPSANSNEDSTVRKRVVSSSVSESSESRLGRIQLTIRYSNRKKLIIVVHKCENLIPCDSDNLSDPYVRMYLMPEKSSKRKTQTVKNNLNPVFDESFDWNISLTELSERVLDVMVKNSVGIFSNSVTRMGRVEIDFQNFDFSTPVTEWFELQNPNESENNSVSTTL